MYKTTTYSNFAFSLLHSSVRFCAFNLRSVMSLSFGIHLNIVELTSKSFLKCLLDVSHGFADYLSQLGRLVGHKLWHIIIQYLQIKTCDG